MERAIKVNNEAGEVKLELLSEIKSRIRERGPITFAEFMDLALYSPDGGYYCGKGGENSIKAEATEGGLPTSEGGRGSLGGASEPTPWGPAGDYFTSLDMGPIFPRLVAKEVYNMYSGFGSPAEFHIIEVGAGRGLLGLGLLDTARERYPDLYSALTLSLVEKGGLRAGSTEPEDGAGGAEGGGVEDDLSGTSKVTWYRDISEVPGPITGVILSNELIDSFPVHRLTSRKGSLKEIYVGLDESESNTGTLTDIIGPPSTEALGCYLERLGVRLEDNQRIEVSLDLEGWVDTVSKKLERGYVMTIDYGLPAAELFSPDRPGTLICHFEHTLNDDPYINIGTQDITTHADFTTLNLLSLNSGMSLGGFTTQGSFFIGVGIEDEYMDMGEMTTADIDAITNNRALKALVMPGGMGDTFKVMVHCKGVGEGGKESLKGFSFREMSRYL